MAAWQRVLQAKLVVPPLPSFAIPSAPFDRRKAELARALSVQPGLYRGIGVVDARCGEAGRVDAADRTLERVRTAGHYKDATTDITVQANGAGVYESGNLRFSVRPDGSGDYWDGSTRVSVRADGSGVYRDGRVDLVVRADGTGSFADGSVRLWRNPDGSAGYVDATSRLSITATGEVTERGDPVHSGAARLVLARPFPKLPPAPPAQLSGAAKGRSCGSVIRLDATVLFDTDQATLRPEARALLSRVARLLAKLKHPRIQVNGHTDLVGTAAYDLDLSRRRAASVVDALVATGTPRKSMTAVGFGESRPLRPETRPDGTVDLEARRLNRRVELILLDGETPLQ